MYSSGLSGAYHADRPISIHFSTNKDWRKQNSNPILGTGENFGMKNLFETHAPAVPDVALSGASLPPEVIRYILQAGIQAPSGDNIQPWKFSVVNNTIYVHLDRQADPSFFNFRQVASILSAGAVLENLRLAATVFGLETDFTFHPDAALPDGLARVDFRFTGRAKDPLHEAIWKRCTNRKIFDRRPIPDSLLECLQAEVSSQSGCRLQVWTARSDLRNLSRSVYKTDRIRTELQELHEFLQHMIRYDDEEAIRRRDGFPIRNLEAGPLGELFLRLSRPWPVMNFLNRIGLGRLVPLYMSWGVLASSAVVSLVAPSLESRDVLRAGQMLERLWLTLAQNGICAQPMATLPFFRLIEQAEGTRAFSPKHQALVNQAWTLCRGLLAPNISDQGVPILLLRLGYAKDVACRTLRKDVDSFLVPWPS
jgi:sulfur-carrier protein adenylyltransferase/sulfurtransferase